MTPEQRARQQIDLLLQQCGWIVQNRSETNLAAGPGVAIREALLKGGEADYLLFAGVKATCRSFFTLFLLAAWVICANTLNGATVPEIVANAKPAVCVVVASDESGNTRDFGTGFFISQDGLFVTNKHVIDGADQVTVKAQNGNRFQCTGILAQPRGMDLSVLKIDAS